MKSYKFKDWLTDHAGQSLLHVSPAYVDIYPKWQPRAWRVGGWLPDLWYYAKCRLWRRYHVVTIRTLPPTWTDADKRLLHAAFAILGSVILGERIFERNCAEGDPADGKSWAWALNEMRELWDWWTTMRPARHAEHDRLLHEWSVLNSRDRRRYTAAHQGWERDGTSPNVVRYSLPDDFVEPEDTSAAWAALRALDESHLAAEDDAMLLRLVAVRGYMWT